MSLNTYTILIVDDVPSDFKILSRVLKSRGWNILFANNGLNGISLAQKSLPDIILLDINLLGMDCLETYQRLKSNSQTQNIPIILIADYINLETKIKGFQLGAVDYISKSFELEEIIGIIQIQLKGKPMQQINKQQNQRFNPEIAQHILTQKNLRKQQIKERELNHRLEAKVAKKTAELLQKNRELETKNQELQRSNIELESFAYAVSHDLQAPLRSIKMFAHLLTQEYKELLQGQPQEYLEYITSGAERMETLIHDLLAYSRAGKNEQTWIPLNLKEVVNTALCNLEAMIRESQAIIQVGNLPTLMINPTEITQLFQNLISNGIKFCPQKQPLIEIGAFYHRDKWQIFVKDNGIGIDPKYHQQIFQVFQRLHSEDDYPGTGIGLSICQKIIKHHGGKIWLKSESHKGSTFYFTLLNQLPNPQNPD